MTLATPNCTAASGDVKTLCDYLTLNVAAPAPTCEYNQYLVDGACANYTSPVEKVAGQLGDQGAIDTGSTAWMLAATALVMIMTPGVGLFYAGLAGKESAGNTILMSFATMCVVTVQWFLFGYSFAFGPGNNGWGSFEWGAFTNVSLFPSAVYGASIPHVLWAVFQCMFAQITPALISGAVIGRMKFTSYLVFVFLWSTLVYDALAHWIWSLTLDDTYTLTALGWLGQLGALDFAGGTVIHVSSGFAALAAAIVLGKRKDPSPPKPHDAPMVVIGGTLLWFGWFGFNAGSAGGSGGIAAQAFWNTHLATACAAVMWLVLERVFEKKVTPMGAAVGAVSGLVGITPACGFVSSWAALVIGFVTPVFCYAAAKLKAKFGPDDTLDAFAVHGVGGAVGAFCTGIFATTAVNAYPGVVDGNTILLGYQVAEITVAAAYSFFMTVAILLLLRFTIGIRISEEEEAEGIDKSEHGMGSYSAAAHGAETKPAPALSVSGNPKYEA